MRMRRLAAAWVGAAVLAAFPGPARGGGDAAKELQSLLREEEASKAGHKEKYFEFRKRFERLAEAHAGTEEAVTARLWLLRNTWWHKEEGTMEKRAAEIADALLRDAPKSKQLAGIADCHYDFAPADLDRILQSLLDGSPHPEVRGAALHRMALRSPPERRKELLGRLKKEFADVPRRHSTLGELADALLSPHDPASLAVGKPAPEIAGRTADGKPMKLSDFKGKVVVLDFFGDW